MFLYFTEKSILRIQLVLWEVIAPPLKRRQRLWLEVALQNLSQKYCCAWEKHLMKQGNKTGTWAFVQSSVQFRQSPHLTRGQIFVSWAVAQ